MRRKRIVRECLILMLMILSLVCSGCTSKLSESEARPEKIDADQARKLLNDGNKRFAEGKALKRNFIPGTQSLVMKPRGPFAVFLACSESEVSPEIVFDRNIGDLLVVRTVGNVLDPIVMGSVEYGVEHYKAPLVVVLGHKKCGIIQEAIDAKDQCPGNIPAIQAKVKNAVNRAIERGEKGDALGRAAEYNVTNIVDELKTSRVVREFKARNGLKVVGATYDEKTGKVTWIEDGGCDLGEGFFIPDKKKNAKAIAKNSNKRPEEIK